MTLVPETKTLSTTLTITALPTGTPDPAREQVAARLLSVSSPLQSQSGPADRHRPCARPRRGGYAYLLQCCPLQPNGGSRHRAHRGRWRRRDRHRCPSSRAAGNPPIEGEATVPAHAAVIGPQGNIAPLRSQWPVLSGGHLGEEHSCLHDGQDAYDFPMVTQPDIDHAAGPLIATLTAATPGDLTRRGTRE